MYSADDDFPKKWDHMPLDEEYRMVVLDVNSDEFSAVKKSFESTCKTYQIVEIKRIQNPVLYRQYMVQKMHMDKKNPKTVNERTLFHGCSGNVTKDISHKGFNRSFAGLHGKI